MLFSLALEKVIHITDVNAEGTILYKSTQPLVYIDDIDITEIYKLPFIQIEDMA